MHDMTPVCKCISWGTGAMELRKIFSVNNMKRRLMVEVLVVRCNQSNLVGVLMMQDNKQTNKVK